jgi:hypothetical protein
MGGKPLLLAAAVMTLVITAPAHVNTTADSARTGSVSTASDDAIPVSTAPVRLSAGTIVTHHLITNLDGATKPATLGFDIFDIGPTPALINALPRNVHGMVWLGQKCPTPIDDAFRSRVRALATNTKVYGYYLSDEPHVASCPGGPAALRSRADYIRNLTGGRQHSFVVLEDRADMRAFRPYVTHVTMVGLDPYPCSISGGCVLSKINSRVNDALAVGIAKARLVPVYQAFGQSLSSQERYYMLPSASQLQAILDRWHQLLPTPYLDYAYSWGHQGMSNPTLIDRPLLQDVFARHFAG